MKHRVSSVVALVVALVVTGPATAQTAPAGSIPVDGWTGLSSAAPAAASDAPSFGRYPAAAEFEEQFVESFYRTMRDGTRLAVAVARPARDGRPVEGRFPVVWHHTLSVADAAANGVGTGRSAYRRMPELTRHGYVVVQVARRGNGQSFGARRGYHERNEAEDAYELTEWLARQPWSNGRVGVYGCSNTGDAAMHVLTNAPPSLQAVWAGCFSWHKYDAMLRGGVLAQWGTGPTRTLEQDLAVPPVKGDESRTLLRRAAEEHQLSTPLLELWRSLPYRDSLSPVVHSRFWGEGSIASYADKIRRAGVPVYVQGGWRDELRGEGITTWLNLSGQARLVIGPWLHCVSDDFSQLDEMRRFFDRHLKDVDTGLDRQPPIHYYTVHAPKGSEWRSSDRWPVAGAQSRTLAFGTGRATLARRPSPGNERSAPASAGATTFAVDYGAKCASPLQGPVAQPCHPPGTGVSFATAPLARGVEVTGDPVVEVWIAADATDAHVFAYLEEVAPDGTVTPVTEGRLRASLRAVHTPPFAAPAVPWHRSYAEDAQPLVPGQPVKLEIALLPTSYVFRKDHRLQVTITGADWRERRVPDGVRPATLTVLHDAQHASRVSLPVVGSVGWR